MAGVVAQGLNMLLPNTTGEVSYLLPQGTAWGRKYGTGLAGLVLLLVPDPASLLLAASTDAQ
jgi:hypothetical protein